MIETRKIAKVLRANPRLKVRCPSQKGIWVQSGSTFDPFLLLDDFRSDNPDHYLKGFPWHPHRGIETITYVLRGDVEHGDSMGNKGIISSGDIHWMTAGNRIITRRCPKEIQMVRCMDSSSGPIFQNPTK